jgi:catechol 2,3-dioxygenase-like lactoylglutathione lyase family enzyme
MFRQPDYTMVNVSDMGRSVAFYRDTLGLALRFESPGWSEFTTGATTLALHTAAAGPSPGDTAAVAPTAGTCSIGFSVSDLEHTCRTLGARGARFVLAPTERAQEGIRIAVCLDPDGLPIFFAQPLAPPSAGPPDPR